MAATIRIGTSGFSYKEWVGGFYPPKLPGTRMLAHYAQRLPTVEINYTFRAMPRRAMLEKWVSEVPEHFRFALKAPERITHAARLRGVADTVAYFADVSSALGTRLGPALFQLPPDFKCDLPLLRDFLATIDGRIRAAFEFRHPSWFTDPVFEALGASTAALCIAETDRLSTPPERTAPFVYLRLRKGDYGGDELKLWARRISDFADHADEIYVYFKHEERAPELALALRAMLPGAL